MRFDALIGSFRPDVNNQAARPRQTFNSKHPSSKGFHNQQSLCPGIYIGIANMPTQYDVDIPFSTSHNQQAFKLLELPPELLALLESENAPSYVALSLSKIHQANYT
jgi:hypothetical protein